MEVFRAKTMDQQLYSSKRTLRLVTDSFFPPWEKQHSLAHPTIYCLRRPKYKKAWVSRLCRILARAMSISESTRTARGSVSALARLGQEGTEDVIVQSAQSPDRTCFPIQASHMQLLKHLYMK